METQTYIQIFENELDKHNIKWCKGCEIKASHKRGFVMNNDKTTIHFDSKVCTRSTLFNGLHELGHCLDNNKGSRSFEKEQNAEQFAKDKFKEYNIAIPRKRLLRGIDYVRRKKRVGDNIIKSKEVNN